MSTASGTPSKKIRWYQQMMAKLENEQRKQAALEGKNEPTGKRPKFNKPKDKPATETP